MKILKVDEKYNEKKLNSFLLDQFDALRLNTLYKALRKKDIRLNGKRISENVVVHTNDEVQLFISDELLFYSCLDNSFEIIYEDDNILIVNKPENIEVLGENSLTTLIKNYYHTENFPYPCHRLDRNTKGLILYAKNQEALDILFDKFKKREIEKHYLCRVVGIPKSNTAILEAYLFKDTKKSQVYISDYFKKGYQKIITSYSIVGKDIRNNTSILDVTLHTGRTHQIRAHLAHIGHPIIGDGKYGINEVNKKFKAKTQELYSHKLKFNFTQNNGILDYLNNKEFLLKTNI